MQLNTAQGMTAIVQSPRRPRPVRRLDYSRLDFDAFMAFKHFRSRKDSRLLDHMAELVARSIQKVQHPWLLDVGSGDGRLAVGAIAASRERASTTALVRLVGVEPACQGARLLRRQVTECRSKGIELEVFEGTVQEYLRTAPTCPTFDLATCIHTLYHIPEPEWGSIFNGIVRRLRAGGTLAIVMAGRSTELYRPLRRLAPNARRLFSEYGLDLFAEDLANWLHQHGWAHQRSEWDAPFLFTAEEVREAWAALGQRRVSRDAPVALDALAFLYRVPLPTVLNQLAGEVGRLLEQFSRADGSVSIPMHEVCFSIPVDALSSGA